MANTALNRTTQVLLTNKSGGALNYGDVVVLDNTNANGFTTTTTAGLSTRGLGVILEPAGIANNASGMVAVGGWCPRVNLNTAATVGQFIKTHTVAGQGAPHSSPQVEGDFAVALTASANPPCNLFGSPNGPTSGGSGTVTNTGTLTSGKAIIGNGSADVTVSSASGVAKLSSGTLSASNVDLTSEVTGDLPLANLAQIAGLSVLGVTGSSTADVAAITATSDGQVLTRVSSSSLTFGTPFGALITETVTSGTAGDVTFSSIPATYRDLMVKVRGRGTTAANDVAIYLQFNSDTGNNYSTGSFLSGTGTIAANTINTSSIAAGFVPASTGLANAAGVIEVLIGDYRGTTFFKATTGRATDPKDNTSGNFLIWVTSGMWKSTSAINAVKVYPSAGSFVDGTVVSLYGLF